MIFTFYNLVYLISCVLGVYAISKIIRTFFKEVHTTRTIEIISYLSYYIFSSAIYIYINIPIVNLCFNLLTIFIITFNYISNVRKKILITLLTYTVMICNEMIVVIFTGYIHFPISEKNDYDSIFGVIVANILLYIFSLILNGFKNIKQGDSLPKTYWICILLIPTSSLFILFTIFKSSNLSQYEILLDIILILLVNFIVFYLYNGISKHLSDEHNKQLLLQQNTYYEKQLTLMESSLQANNSLRHDMKNHFTVVYSSLEKNDIDVAKKHISEIIDIYQAKNKYISSGNSAIDSVLSFKLQEADQLNIELNYDITIPPKIPFEAFDSVVILGNLLDNAIQAVSPLCNNRYILFTMKYSKGLLIIKSQNSFNGVIKKNKNQILSLKPDNEMHGFGLKNIQQAVEKYNGILNISTEDNLFKVSIMIYLT